MKKKRLSLLVLVILVLCAFLLPWRAAADRIGVLVNGVYVLDLASTLSGYTTTAQISNTAYGAGWDGNTTAPTKNSVYDKIETLAGGHDAVTLSTVAATILGLSTQEIDFDNQTENTMLAGPATGSTALKPTFRSLVAADIPSLSGTYLPLAGGTLTGNTLLDDGSGASPNLTFQDETNETAIFGKVDAGFLTLTTDATDGLNILTGNLKVGNGSPTQTQNGEDGYVEGTFEVDGAIYADNAIVQSNSAVDVQIAGRVIATAVTNTFVANASDNSTSGSFDFWRAHTASGNVADDDVLGVINFKGQTAGGVESGAAIQAVVNGTPGNADLPTELLFQVAPDGSATPATALTLDNSKLATFAGSVKVDGAQLKIPSSNADPTATAGYLRHDATVTNHANGALRWHDGTNIRHVVDMVAATAEGCTDGYAVVYDAGTDLFKCAAGGGAGDITDVFNCSTGDCPILTAGSADALNMTDGNYSIPTKVSTDCSGQTGEGRACWESDTDTLWVGDGTAAKVVSRTQPIVTVSSTRSVTIAEMNGGFLNVTGAYTATLPDCSATTLGISGTFNATTAAVFTLDTDGTDAIVLSGTALTAGYTIDSDGYAGSQVEVVCTAANTWTTRHMKGVFVDGGAT